MWVAVYFGLPALVLFACSKSKFLDNIGGVVLCYVLGLIIGNVGILPENAFEMQDMLTTIVIPLALPLIFFSMNLGRWKKHAGMAAKTFGGALAAIVIASVITFFIFQPHIGEEAWKIAGMLVGVYSGGTPNMASIGTALNIESSQYIAVHASDVVVTGALFLLIISVIPKLLKRILPKYKTEENGLSSKEQSEAVKEFQPYFNGFQSKHFLPLLAAVGLAILIFAVGGGLSMVVPESISMVVAILMITTLGVLASFIPKVRNIKFTFQLGYYLLLVFSLVVSSMADILKLTESAPTIMLYIAVLMILSMSIHLLFSHWMKVDADTHLVTATAMIYSPPFVPVVAAALKNKDVIMTGMLAGIAGWIIGNYLGIGFAYLMHILV